jgi:hypothetical protein
MEVKNINTTEMIRKIRNKFARRLAGKTHAERLAFYRDQAQKMQNKIPALFTPPGAGDVNDSKQAPAWLGNLDTETTSTLIREKRASYTKAKQ